MWNQRQHNVLASHRLLEQTGKTVSIPHSFLHLPGFLPIAYGAIIFRYSAMEGLTVVCKLKDIHHAPSFSCWGKATILLELPCTKRYRAECSFCPFICFVSFSSYNHLSPELHFGGILFLLYKLPFSCLCSFGSIARGASDAKLAHLPAFCLVRPFPFHYYYFTRFQVIVSRLNPHNWT